jgi:hypothetical protein
VEYGRERQHDTSKIGRPRMRCWNNVTIQRKNGSRGTRNDLAIRNFQCLHKLMMMMMMMMMMMTTTHMNANCTKQPEFPVQKTQNTFT